MCTSGSPHLSAGGGQWQATTPPKVAVKDGGLLNFTQWGRAVMCLFEMARKGKARSFRTASELLLTRNGPLAACEQCSPKEEVHAIPNRRWRLCRDGSFARLSGLPALFPFQARPLHWHHHFQDGFSFFL